MRFVFLPTFFLFCVLSIAAANEISYTPDSVAILEPDCQSCRASEIEALPEVRTHRQGKFYDEKTFREMKEHARYNPSAPAGIEVSLWKESGPLPAAPPLRSGFDGLNMRTALNFFPPDTQIAVGPNHVLQATNGGIRLSSKTNTNVSIVSLNTFFQKQGAFLFDPKLFFDPLSGRFFVAVLEFNDSPQTSLIRFAVSQSSNPASLTSGWCRYSYSGKVEGTWADYPSLGMNEKWMAIHTNNFKFSDNTYARSIVKVADKTKLVNNATSCPKLKLFSFGFPFPGAGISGTIQFAQTITSTALPGTPLFAVSTLGGDAAIYDFWRVSGTGNPTMTKVRLTSRPYTTPPDAKHKSTGQEYETDTPRTLHAVARNDVVTFTFTTGCNFGSLPNESCFRIAQIAANSTGAGITFEGDFGGGANKFFWMPAVVVNGSGDLAVVFQQSSPSLFVGTAYTGKKSAATTMEPFKILQNGKCNLIQSDGSRNRTGDYAGAALDPADNRSFWLSAEYSTNMSGACVWSTRIGKASY